jgi:hypothetical protein
VRGALLREEAVELGAKPAVGDGDGDQVDAQQPREQ